MWNDLLDPAKARSCPPAAVRLFLVAVSSGIIFEGVLGHKPVRCMFNGLKIYLKLI